MLGRSVDVWFCFTDGFDGEKGLSVVGLGVGTGLVGAPVGCVGCFLELLLVGAGLGVPVDNNGVGFLDGLVVDKGLPVGVNEEFNIGTGAEAFVKLLALVGDRVGKADGASEIVGIRL
jgi:hypothetical protein